MPIDISTGADLVTGQTQQQAANGASGSYLSAYLGMVDAYGKATLLDEKHNLAFIFNELVLGSQAEMEIISESTLKVSATGAVIHEGASHSFTIGAVSVTNAFTVTGLSSLDGGIDVSGASFAVDSSGNITGVGTYVSTNATAATSATAGGAIRVAGGIASNGVSYFGDVVNFTDMTASTNKTSGAVVVTGGFGVSGASNVDDLTVHGTFTTLGPVNQTVGTTTTYEDTLLVLAYNDNVGGTDSSSVYEMGFLAHYATGTPGDGSTNFTAGMFWMQDGTRRWVLGEDVAESPTGTVAVTTYGDLQIKDLLAVGATFSGNIGAVGGSFSGTVSFNGDVDTNIVPDTNSAYNLGSSTAAWLNLFVDKIDFSAGTEVSGSNEIILGANLADALSITDGSTDLVTVVTTTGSMSFNILTAFDVTGATTLNGAVTLGDASVDDITVTGSIASHIVSKTDSTYNLGSSSIAWATLFTDNIDFTTSASTGTNVITLKNNLADALSIVDSAGDIVVVDTTTGSVVFKVISAFDVTGATTLNGAVTLGNASGDDITVTGSIASHVVPKTGATYNLGSASIAWSNLFVQKVNFIGASTANEIILTDSIADALSITDGTDDIVVINSLGSTVLFTTYALDVDVAMNVSGIITLDGNPAKITTSTQNLVLESSTGAILLNEIKIVDNVASATNYGNFTNWFVQDSGGSQQIFSTVYNYMRESGASNKHIDDGASGGANVLKVEEMLGLKAYANGATINLDHAEDRPQGHFYTVLTNGYGADLPELFFEGLKIVQWNGTSYSLNAGAIAIDMQSCYAQSKTDGDNPTILMNGYDLDIQIDATSAFLLRSVEAGTEDFGTRFAEVDAYQQGYSYHHSNIKADATIAAGFGLMRTNGSYFKFTITGNVGSETILITDGSTVQHTLTEGTDFNNAVGDTVTTASNIATAINGKSNYSATSSGSTVTAYCYEKTAFIDNASTAISGSGTLGTILYKAIAVATKSNSNTAGLDFLGILAKDCVQGDSVELHLPGTVAPIRVTDYASATALTLGVEVYVAPDDVNHDAGEFFHEEDIAEIIGGGVMQVAGKIVALKTKELSLGTYGNLAGDNPVQILVEKRFVGNVPV